MQQANGASTTPQHSLAMYICCCDKYKNLALVLFLRVKVSAMYNVLRTQRKHDLNPAHVATAVVQI